MLIDIQISHPFTSFEKIPVTIFEEAQEACIKVAEEIADLIRLKQQQGSNAVLGLSTGSTPKKIYAELIRLHRQEGLSFKNVICFNLDEYFPISGESIQSYKYFMKENLFNHINIEPKNYHIPDGQIGLENIKQYCEEYEHKIQAAGGIDFQLLGIGRNGHIGFNEPGSHISSSTRLITLDRITRSDAAVDFSGIANVPRKAITMGINTILSAKRIVLLAWGERKADIIKMAVEGPVTEFVPASYLQAHPNTSLVVDDAAAGLLTRKKAPWLTEDVEWTKQMTKKAVIWLAISCNKPILKLTNNDYNENGLSSLLVLHGTAYDINIKVFNWLQHTITGWPGGKPDADDTNRPERAEPAKKRILIFSPHPDDDIISMGGTFQRLTDQGHEVHVAYQTSGNIAVADDEAFRFVEFVKDFNQQFQINSPNAEKIFIDTDSFLQQKKSGEPDIQELRFVKGLIRKGEARNTCRFVGIPDENIHYLNLPFYETGTVEKKPIGEDDIKIITSLVQQIKPHQIFAAGDLADPHGTHKVCLDGILAALANIKHLDFMKDCWLWLYKGAWAEWDIDAIEMAVPMSPEQVLRKRYGIFKHQSQKDGVVFQGTDNREFWQRAEERNRATAELYNKLGLAEYEAMEAFVRWRF
jgi:glucosamine-6-phosphate deaminase